ncbi:phosphate/phosphite/phosphonate ABC transporter substrate-binding protein [Thiohalophilus sp.]|uniref:phosphate/phosphite/phosphonate ABC transporter substrate-binding protein n=1 Tax=Thiohalophilus sp. TaxID=3028392 RepID=UPI002ACF05C0|nr:phosphate/phosphite/phosphonate ABC transporter substrate-binding protein [Thiohalophilus sp.]MDZ7805216.1 phosphate/phosphite/phosphonate ABC transporter substrate-binding protein [Thiohalophilus sp.]
MQSSLPRFARTAALLLVAMLLCLQPAQAALVKIGVFSPEGFAAGMQRWQPSADYLAQQLPAHRFQVLPYQDLGELEQDARRGKFDFVLTHPASFVQLEQQAGLLRLLTRRHRDGAQQHAHAAVVIFTRADNRRIQGLADFARTPFVATRGQDYSSWQLVRLELQRLGQDPDHAFSGVTFAGHSEAVLDAVMRGDYPAGAMAARDFDRFLRQGRISPQAVRILEASETADFPFRFSGRLYPQWPLGVLPDTPAELRQAVQQSLLALPEGHAALQAGDYAGWQPADNYQAVRPILSKSLSRHVVERQLSVANLWLEQHRQTLLITLAFTLLAWLLVRLFGPAAQTRPRL